MQWHCALASVCLAVLGHCALAKAAHYDLATAASKLLESARLHLCLGLHFEGCFRDRLLGVTFRCL